MSTSEHESIPLRTRILWLLALHDDGLHGYALMRELEVSNGSLYPALARLLGAGHIDIFDGPNVGRGKHKDEPRKHYAITSEGRAHLRELRAGKKSRETSSARQPVSAPSTPKKARPVPRTAQGLAT